ISSHFPFFSTDLLLSEPSPHPAHLPPRPLAPSPFRFFFLFLSSPPQNPPNPSPVSLMPRLARAPARSAARSLAQNMILSQDEKESMKFYNIYAYKAGFSIRKKTHYKAKKKDNMITSLHYAIAQIEIKGKIIKAHLKNKCSIVELVVKHI
ncbi:hypothetical protein ACMD2_21226, partial [Ananas comosus]